MNSPTNETPSVRDAMKCTRCKGKRIVPYDIRLSCYPEDRPCPNCTDGKSAVIATRAPASAPNDPCAYVSAGQLAAISDDKGDLAGTYLPIRKSPAGNFTTPLYMSPALVLGDEAMRDVCAKVADAEWENRERENQAGSLLGLGGACAASRIAAAIRALPLAATPPTVSGDLSEKIAQFLHDEGEFADAWSGRTWPEHPDDTGQREGGFVRIVPSDVQAKFRDVARRLVTMLPKATVSEDLTERKRIIDWLRLHTGSFKAYVVADAIERGEHVTVSEGEKA